MQPNNPDSHPRARYDDPEDIHHLQRYCECIAYCWIRTYVFCVATHFGVTCEGACEKGHEWELALTIVSQMEHQNVIGLFAYRTYLLINVCLPAKVDRCPITYNAAIVPRPCYSTSRPASRN